MSNKREDYETWEEWEEALHAAIRKLCQSYRRMERTPPTLNPPQTPVDLHVPGAKDDAGKPRMGLVFSGFQNALVEVAKVGTFGAKKYSDNGWEHVDDGPARYTDALFRHLLGAGHTDPETDLPHLAHAAWNVLAVLELELRNREWEN